MKPFKSRTQFIIVGDADSDTQTPLCLLTRRVFTSYESAQAFAAKCNRNPQIVECYFPVPASLYRSDWEPSRSFQPIPEGQ